MLHSNHSQFANFFSTIKRSSKSTQKYYLVLSAANKNKKFNVYMMKLLLWMLILAITLKCGLMQAHLTDFDGKLQFYGWGKKFDE